MKTIYLISICCLLQMSVAAQSWVPVTFVIDDFDSHKNIAGAMVNLRQIAETVPTDGAGKASFKSVPEGEIEFYIVKDGYQFYTDRVNVSKESKTNVFRISLSKVDDKKILVTGKVVDNAGNYVSNAMVEVKLADQIRDVMTDIRGNYNADLQPNPKYQSLLIRIDVEKGDCKKTEYADLPRGNVVNKDFKLDCPTAAEVRKKATPEGGVDPVIIPNSSEPLDEKTIDGVKITLDRFEQRGNTVTFFYTLENMRTTQMIRELASYADSFEFIDQLGNEYRGENATLGNSQGKRAGAKLVLNTPVQGTIQFDVGGIKVTKAALLNIGYLNGMQFINVPLKK